MTSSLFESIYNISPLPLQNLIISTYGIGLYRSRYCGNHNRYLSRLLEEQYLSSDEIRENTNRRLRNIVTYSYEKVPYYKELFDKNRLKPGDIQTTDDITKIPLLDKETVRLRTDEFISNLYNKRSLLCINTSGTTGKTMKIYVDKDSRRFSYAFYSRLKRWAQIGNGHNITFAGRVFIPPSQREKIFWRTNAIMKNYLFSSYHISQENIPYYVEEINRIKPEFIDSYPSSVYNIARFAMEKGCYIHSPKAIITSSETLLDHQREIISKVFNAPIFDQYGSAEQVLFISQCEYGTYHVHPEFGFVEIIKNTNNEAGEVVATGFTNKAMPLIRYRIGDTALMGRGRCQCKKNFPIIEKIIGRVDDVIITPEGNYVGRLDPIFKGLSTVKSAQIVQNKIDQIIVNLVPADDYAENDGQAIIRELEKRLGEKMRISINIVSDIPLTKTGKFRSVISYVHGNNFAQERN